MVLFIKENMFMLITVAFVFPLSFRSFYSTAFCSLSMKGCMLTSTRGSMEKSWPLCCAFFLEALPMMLHSQVKHFHSIHSILLNNNSNEYSTRLFSYIFALYQARRISAEFCFNYSMFVLSQSSFTQLSQNLFCAMFHSWMQHHGKCF